MKAVPYRELVGSCCISPPPHARTSLTSSACCVDLSKTPEKLIGTRRSACCGIWRGRSICVLPGSLYKHSPTPIWVEIRTTAVLRMALLSVQVEGGRAVG